MRAERVTYTNRHGQRAVAYLEPATESVYNLVGWLLDSDGTDRQAMLTIDRSTIIDRTPVTLNPTTGYLEATS